MLADLWQRVPDFDVVHIHTLYRFHDLAAAIVARRNHVPYVIQAHGSLDPWHRAHRRRPKDLYHALVEDPIIRGAAVIVCTSERESRSIRELRYEVPRWVIPIGIDVDSLRNPAPPDAFPGIRPEPDERILTFIGRLTAKKGVPLLVEAFRAVAADYPTARLVIAGPDDEAIGARLSAALADARLVARVAFVGPVDGEVKRALLQRSDVFVLPSADESFGVAIAEAMAVGCPVVASPEVAIQDVIARAGAGIVAMREPEAIARAIRVILGDPSGAAAMGDAGKAVVDSLYSLRSVSAVADAMYAAVVTAHPRRGAGPATRSADTVVPKATQSWFCPHCKGAIIESDVLLHCPACGWTGEICDGIPVLLADPVFAKHDETDHHIERHDKASQSAHFDRLTEVAFETVRPHGTPRLYRFLVAEKLRRALGPIRPHLVGASALAVCGGSGMDAEFLVKAGALVTTSDLSLGAAVRAADRTHRYGLAVRSIVADAEQLPFADRSVDLVTVHDGLHHLEDPYVGLAEMARVARRWVVVTEPAQASITHLAVRFGLARETEHSGNRVARMDPGEASAFLEARGFVVLRSSRYAMYYPHNPGPWFRRLSQPGVFPVVRTGWSIVNAVLGRFGNKMVLVAERNTGSTG